MIKLLRYLVSDFPVNQFKNGSITVKFEFLTKWVLVKVKSAIFRIINMPWAILATVIIRILRPWILIRVGIFKSHRIGHFITDAHYQIVLTKIGEVDSIDLWATGAISNQSYNRIIKRNLYVSKYFEHIYYWNHIIPGGKVNQVNTLRNSRDTSGIFTKHLTHINFSDDESAIGLSWLMDFGWKQGEPFICLLNRDQKYLNDQIKSSKLGILPKNFYDYHSYRNSSIIEYQKSILWMIEKGYWIIRMGKAAEQKLLINHRQLIDYPFLDTQSDLLDLWIFSNCSACISTGTGIDCLSWIQGIPSLALNYLPLMNAVTAYNVITVPKNLFWLDNHKELNLKEYLKHGYFETQEYEKNGIAICDLTENEILEATKELIFKLESTHVYDVEDNFRQKLFLDELRKQSNFNIAHDFIHKEFKIGASWLKSKGPNFFY